MPGWTTELGKLLSQSMISPQEYAACRILSSFANAHGLGVIFGGNAVTGSLLLSCDFFTATTAATAPPATAAPMIASVVPVSIPATAVVLTPIVVDVLVPAIVLVTDVEVGVGPAVKLVVAMPCALVLTVTLAPAAAPEPRVPPPDPPARNTIGTSGTGRSFLSVTLT